MANEKFTSKNSRLDDMPCARQNSQCASAVCGTQRDAIKRAKEIAPGFTSTVERVRKAAGGSKPHWRSATGRKAKK